MDENDIKQNGVASKDFNGLCEYGDDTWGQIVISRSW